jgi:type II secretory pathway pseudopilin PulG
MKLKFLNRKRKGFTLVEILLVTGFISVASISIYAVFKASSTTSKAKEEMWLLEEFSNKIKANYGVVSNYAGVTPAVVIANNYAPEKYVSGGALVNTFGGGMNLSAATIGGGTPNNAFMITSWNVPRDVCPKLVSMASQHFNMVRINGMIIKDINTVQINPANMAAWCANVNNTLDFFSL